MHVLFLGGTGNISTSVSRLCLERGITLTLLNRGIRDTHIPGAEKLTADLNDPASLRRALAGRRWDVVVDWFAFNVSDVERDITLFRDATSQFVFISSASAYQKPPLHPIITESTPLANPFWDYSRNKIACEARLMTAFREDQFPATIVRPSLTYDTVIPVPIGGWTEFTVVDRIRKKKEIIVHGDGSSLWTVTHAEDFAKGFVGLLGQDKAIGEAFHITSDEILTWDQIHYALAEAAGETPRIVHIASDFLVRCEPSLTGSLLGDKSASVMFDNSKIKRFVPDYAALIPFSTGIRRTLRWFEEDPSRCIVREETNRMIDAILGRYASAFGSGGV